MYRRILVATDFSPAAAEAAGFARQVADEGAAFSMVHVSEGVWAQPVPHLEPPPVFDATRIEARLAEAARSAGLAGGRLFARTGRPAQEIARAADEFDADLVVLGATGATRAQRLLLGSTARGVVRATLRDTLVARGPATLRVIAAATDFSPGAESATARAAEIARVRGARLLLIHALDPNPVMSALLPDGGAAYNPREARDFLATLLQKRAAATNPAATAMVVEGPTATALGRALTEQAADLVVVGARGTSRLERWILGSIAETVIERSPCSVLSVHPRNGPAKG